MMSAKMATPGFLKTALFWNKGYDIIIPVHNMSMFLSKISPRDSNYVVDVVMWSSPVTLAFLWEKLS